MKKIIVIRNKADMLKDLLLVVLAAMLITQFIATRTHVPSGSMEPTIMTGDNLIINKIGAYYREPTRGEIVIFKEGGEQLVKRLIGMPGDTIELIDGKVYINSTLLEEGQYLADTVVTLPLYDPRYEPVEFPYEVPQDSYFFMGDNRGHSLDSRVFGSIKKSAVIAIGAYRIYPFNEIGHLE